MATDREPDAAAVARKKEVLQQMLSAAETGRGGGFFRKGGTVLNQAGENVLQAIHEQVGAEAESGSTPGEEDA